MGTLAIILVQLAIVLAVAAGPVNWYEDELQRVLTRV